MSPDYMTIYYLIILNMIRIDYIRCIWYDIWPDTIRSDAICSDRIISEYILYLISSDQSRAEQNWSDKIVLYHTRSDMSLEISNQIQSDRYGYIGHNWTKSDMIRSSTIRLDQIISYEIQCYEMRWDEIRGDQIRLDEIEADHTWPDDHLINSQSTMCIYVNSALYQKEALTYYHSHKLHFTQI